jgi:Mn2+/Fe2+ NRAMP family transporter
MKKSSLSSVIMGAAFLMATSAVGPGFLTQTTVFTRDLLASFGFVILLSIVLDIFAQLNIWRVLTVSGKRGQTVANETIPGSGYLLAALIVFGGLVFNIGNIAGAGLGLQVLFGFDLKQLQLTQNLAGTFGPGFTENLEVKIFAVISAAKK